SRTLFYGGVVRPASGWGWRAGSADVSRGGSAARLGGGRVGRRSGGRSVAGRTKAERGAGIWRHANRERSEWRRSRDAWRRAGAGTGTAGPQAGLTAADCSDATGAHGLVTGFGDTGPDGIGGITLGGGAGYLVRAHGLTIDDLLAADVVTADGRLLRVDERSH